jgi:hypothetical protein
MTELWKVLPDLTSAQALHWLEQERTRIRQGASRVVQSQTPFASYAVSLLERKIRARDIKSEAGIRKWNTCLKRLFPSCRPVPREDAASGLCAMA